MFLSLVVLWFNITASYLNAIMFKACYSGCFCVNLEYFCTFFTISERKSAGAGGTGTHRLRERAVLVRNSAGAGDCRFKKPRRALEWTNIPQATINNLINSMRRRHVELREANGGHTRY